MTDHAEVGQLSGQRAGGASGGSTQAAPSAAHGHPSSPHREVGAQPVPLLPWERAVGMAADMLLMKQKQLSGPDNLNQIVLQESENGVVEQLSKTLLLISIRCCYGRLYGSKTEV